MHPYKKFCRRLICLSLFIPLLALQVQAGQEITLARLNPLNTAFGVFHSYKHRLLLVALVQTDKSAFKCLPNQYYLYQYGRERFSEMSGGNLKINSDFTRIFRTRIHSLSGVQLSNKDQREQRLKMLSKTLKIPTGLFSAAQQKSNNPDRICWQQPELLDMEQQRVRTFPFLAANLCEKQWCSDLYWTGPDSIRLWIHSKPKTFQLINLDVNKSTYTVKASTPLFVKQSIPQLNAPRENLVNSKTLNGKTLSLKKSAGNHVSLEWHKETSGHIVVSLIRKGSDATAAQEEQKRYRQLAADKEFRGALQSTEFALWLDPQNQSIKIDRAKLFITLSMVSRFFESLKTEFSSAERFAACQKLHIDPFMRPLWNKEGFARQFKQICSP